MKAEELRKLENNQLNDKAQEFQEELFNLRFQHATAQLENTERIAAVRKNIARIRTILREREMEAVNG